MHWQLQRNRFGDSMLRLQIISFANDFEHVQVTGLAFFHNGEND